MRPTLMEHDELVAELARLERVTAQERIELAKSRRGTQLLCNMEYERTTAVPRTRNARLRFSAGIALLEATGRGDYQEVEQLLQSGSDPNSHNEDGLTPLHQCAIDNNEQLVRLLIKFNADVNAKDTELWTPLHAAACCGYIDIVRLLISNGADLLAVNAEGNMPYDICDDEATLDVIENEMANEGITQRRIDDERAEPEKRMLGDMKQLRSQGRPLDSVQTDGSTYLHVAAAHGYYDVAAFLLRVGVNPTVRDYDLWTPLHAAAHWNQTDVIELLCDYNADISLKTASGETAFDLADDPNTKAVIQNLQQQEARKKRMAFGVRDSRRQSRRRKKYESPQAGPVVPGENPFSARGAIRRQSLRDRSGLTPARLEAQQEQSNLIRSWSREDVANQQEDVSQYAGGRPGGAPTRDSPNKRVLKGGGSKTKPMSPDEWIKKLDAETTLDGDDDFDEGDLSRSGHGRSGSRKKKKKAPPPDPEHGDPRVPGHGMAGGKPGSFGGPAARDKKVCCCTIL